MLLNELTELAMAVDVEQTMPETSTEEQWEVGDDEPSELDVHTEL